MPLRTGDGHRTNIPFPLTKNTIVSTAVLDRLVDELHAVMPKARRAATGVLENPKEVSVSTVREVAEAAQVKPDTLVRMARQIGFEGYNDFRAPFRDAIRQGAADFPDRTPGSIA